MASMSLTDILAKGGPVVAILLLMSVGALAIVLAKLAEFRRLKLRRLELVGPVEEAVKAGDPESALRLLSASVNPVARVLEAAIVSGNEAEVTRVGSAELGLLESRLRGLAIIAHTSPLLGLLGTVMGMITAFMNIERSGAMVDPSVLSAGIWQALVTTALGLVVAIPSLTAFHLLEGEVDRLRTAMSDASVRVLLATGAKAGAVAGGLGGARTAGEDYGV